MYDRGGMDEQQEHKKHMGAAFLHLVIAGCWIYVYSEWLNRSNNEVEPCCAYELNGQWEFAACNNTPLLTTIYHVSAEFRLINVWGVVLYVFLACSALGHCVKPFRIFTKIFGSLIWVLIFVYFMCCNVYRFRDPGRACSLDFGSGTATIVQETEWFN